MNKNPFSPILLLIVGLSLSACATMQEASETPATVEGATSEVVYDEDVDAIIAQHLEARGGAGMIKDINTMKWEGEMLLQGTNMAATLHFKRPDLRHVVVTIEGMGQAAIAYDGEGYWVLNPEPMNPQDIPGAIAESVFPMPELYEDLADLGESGHTVTFEAMEELESGPAYMLSMMQGEETSSTLYIDAESHMLVREEFESVNPQTGEPSPFVNTYSDYRDVGGIMMPFALERTASGQVAFSATFTSLEANVEVEDNVFQKPIPKPSIR